WTTKSVIPTAAPTRRIPRASSTSGESARELGSTPARAGVGVSVRVVGAVVSVVAGPTVTPIGVAPGGGTIATAVVEVVTAVRAVPPAVTDVPLPAGATRTVWDTWGPFPCGSSARAVIV